MIRALALALVFGVAVSAQAQTVSVLWDPSPEPVAGYVVFLGTSPGAYAVTKDVGPAQVYTQPAVYGTTYYAAVSAYTITAGTGEKVIGPKSAKASGMVSQTPPPPLPPIEICASDGTGNGIDDDKDGVIDEGCLPPPDIEPPSISLTVGRRTGNNYPVTATVADNIGIAHVEFWVDGILQVRLVVPPWSSRIQIKAGGTHVVTARAYDASGNNSVSTVTVRR